MLIVYHKGTGTYFDVDDDVVLINTKDLDHFETAELEDGNDDVLADVAESSRATPFWEAFDPFNEHHSNPDYKER